jgi:hypothetical protein
VASTKWSLRRARKAVPNLRLPQLRALVAFSFTPGLAVWLRLHGMQYLERAGSGYGAGTARQLDRSTCDFPQSTEADREKRGKPGGALHQRSTRLPCLPPLMGAKSGPRWISTRASETLEVPLLLARKTAICLQGLRRAPYRPLSASVPATPKKRTDAA